MLEEIFEQALEISAEGAVRGMELYILALLATVMM